MTVSNSRYPIGSIQDITHREQASLKLIAKRMQSTCEEWDQLRQWPAEGLSKTYRSGGWTVHQLALHTADAHWHGLNRLRYGLTTENYQIQPFQPDDWLELPDALLSVEHGLNSLEVANAHWVMLLEHIDADLLDRQVQHPEEGTQDLWRLIAKHDWHLRHHFAHVRLALSEDNKGKTN